MFCRSDEEHGREMETRQRTLVRERDRWRHMFGAQLTGSGNVKERIRNAKFQVLTALFVRSEVP